MERTLAEHSSQPRMHAVAHIKHAKLAKEKSTLPTALLIYLFSYTNIFNAKNEQQRFASSFLMIYMRL
jgi:hypothetical protein